MTTFGKAAVRCLVYGGLILLTATLVRPLFPERARGPSFETQRKEQQRIARERVVTAGGWVAVRNTTVRIQLEGKLAGSSYTGSLTSNIVELKIP